MANTKTALKQWRVSLRKRARNRPARRFVRTLLGRARSVIRAKQAEDATTAVARAVQALDRAAEKGMLHKNNAARRKSRLVRQLNALQAASA